MVTAIAALLPETAGSAIEHHTSIIVDLIDRLQTAGGAIDNLVLVVRNFSSSIGDVRTVTEDGIYSFLVQAVSAAVDALATTPEVVELDTRLGALGRIMEELYVKANARIKGAIDLLVQRVGITIQGIARRVLHLEEELLYDSSIIGMGRISTTTGIHSVLAGAPLVTSLAPGTPSPLMAALQLRTPVMNSGVQVTMLGEMWNAQVTMER